MPGTWTHDKVSVGVALVGTPLAHSACLAITPEPRATMLTLVIVASHIAGSFWLSPDLDMNGVVARRWGRFRWIWVPYRALIPHHRHWLSHGYGWSAVIRLLYIMAPVLIIIGIAVVIDSSVRRTLLSFTDENIDILISLVVGFVISDIAHVFTDRMVTIFRRRKQ